MIMITLYFANTLAVWVRGSGSRKYGDSEDRCRLGGKKAGTYLTYACQCRATNMIYFMQLYADRRSVKQRINYLKVELLQSVLEEHLRAEMLVRPSHSKTNR